LLHLFFETGLPIDNVYLGRVLNNISEPYRSEPEFIQLKEIYDNRLKPFFEDRNKAVHHFQLEAQYYWGHIENYQDSEIQSNLNQQKQNIPEFMENHLELCFLGYEIAINLIDKLPDK